MTKPGPLCGFRACLLLALVLLGGNAPAQTGKTDAAVPPIAPASYAGRLPCASCPGVDWTLTLLSDGSYRLRRVYLEAEKGEDRTAVTQGRWATGGSPDRLLLQGSRDGPIQLRAAEADALELLDRQGKPMASDANHSLRRLETLDRIAGPMAMRGEFRYMADAGLFADCRTGLAYPVAHAGDNAALERAYGQARTEPGAPVLVRFAGRYEPRPSMEGDGPKEFVVVDRFEAAETGKRCEGAVDPAPLAGTYWRLIALPGAPDASVDQAARAHIMLHADGGRVSGSSGCNRVSGGYSLDGAALSFGPLAGTRRACAPALMELEQRFLTALAAATGYVIDREMLTLAGPDGPVARFERYLE